MTAVTTRMVLALAPLHYISNDTYLHQNVSGKLDCLHACMHHILCVTVLYNTVTDDCYFYNLRATPADAGGYPVNNDVLMYNSNRGNVLL